MEDSILTFDAYSSKINALLDQFQRTQFPNLDEVSDKIVEAYRNHKRFLVFGTGHSHMMAEEFYARAGGLAFITPMLQNELTLTDHPMKSTMIERTEGMAKVYFDLYHLEAGDVLMIASNSGRNPLPVELAKMANEAGLTVVAFVNASQAKVIGSRHSSGKNLDVYAHYVIDNCGEFGDACFDIGDGLKMGSSSTIIGAFMAQSLSILVAKKIKDLGLEIPVFKSSNLDNADDTNKALFERFCKMF